MHASRRSDANFAIKGLTYIVFVLLAIFTLIPFYSMFIMGTYDSYRLFEFDGLPSNYLSANWKTVMKVPEMGDFFTNSLIVSAVAVSLGVLICTACGYGLAKFSFKGRDSLNRLVLFTMMVPYQLGLVAYVWEMRVLHLNDTLVPTILPSLCLGFGVFWMTQYIRDTVPTEIMESARIDAAGEVRIFFNIIFPIISPAIVTLGLLIFIWSWNSFLVPLLTINDVHKYTLPLGVTLFNGLYSTDNGAKILAISLSTLPVILVYVLFSNKLISGLTAGAVKG
ncbi:carbohydrate ABC transporter permease [Cohnella endophytica]|uniref:Carbohydrate ABC transporter permease n=1 Tax=Cohnella endophytica TaxID=2419778 RepID=A0A494XNQ8_9BACL|nr:carbohydrate ABC transporter permease [Cohnella endophytica]RKP51361.1 carbohydrate ABC transporter permease [Cohnella endophytica]